MTDKLFKNKYRTQTTRLRGWDYSSSGWYFITVCTQNKEHYFGEIINGQMNFSELGFVAASQWLTIQRVFGVIIPDEWVIMPNHIHFLFGIDNPKDKYQPNEFQKVAKNSVSTIINHFKGRVTKYADKEKVDFEWQSKFHDNIVRTQDDFNRIQNYIIENPQKWDTDRFYK